MFLLLTFQLYRLLSWFCSFESTLSWSLRLETGTEASRFLLPFLLDCWETSFLLQLRTSFMYSWSTSFWSRSIFCLLYTLSKSSLALPDLIFCNLVAILLQALKHNYNYCDVVKTSLCCRVFKNALDTVSWKLMDAARILVHGVPDCTHNIKIR